jgi:DGQHR domain-containing protein
MSDDNQKSFKFTDQDKIELSFEALCIKQPIGDLYAARIDSQSIQRITYFDVRRRIEEDRDIDRYLGIQRPLNPKRVSELNKYVQFSDASFPSAIIISVESDYARYDEGTKCLYLSNTREGESAPSTSINRLCRVIDGQHRIAGLSTFLGKNFDVIASVFVGSDISDQAYVFATVNLEQNKVNKSLAIDLYSLAKSRSPYKTCNYIAVALDGSPSSPFYGKIKRLGVATEGRGNSETLTQATFVEGLIPYISNDPKSDRDVLLKGGKLQKVSGRELEKMVFRNVFIEEEDVKIGRIYEQYFLAVKERWPSAWNSQGQGDMLSRTNGYKALSTIFGRVYRHLGGAGQYVSKEDFSRLFKKVNADDRYFDTENFKPGTSGESALKHFLLRGMSLD